ncbi:hypothetical protein ACFQ6N_24745 [Kitasatospora sp. NPDC056446]|uniref:hypothetical protein n=1 Tax=Kitasatospora sp. NPDC056446 TaxID=3345819 RepID=UPI0036BF89C9
MSIGIRVLRSAGAATVALAAIGALTLGTAGGAAADTDPPAGAAGVAVDLPLPPGAAWSDPTAVNDSGVIVGFVTDTQYRDTPVRWNADLSPTALPLLPGDRDGRAVGVSNDGSAVGYSGNRTVRWSPAGTVSVLPLLPGDTAGWGYIHAVSRTGTAVGHSAVGAASHAVKWGPDGQAVALPPLNGDVNSNALSVNASGAVAGLSYSPSGVAHPVRWSPNGTPTALDPASAYTGVWVVQINDAGTVVGRGTPTGAANDQWRSMTWKADGTVTDLGRHSTANAVNAAGTVVGKQGGADNIDYTATSWSPDGTATTLGADFEYTTAVAVNDAGVSVGYTGNKVPQSVDRYGLRWGADAAQTELNTVPGGNSYPVAVNSSGLAVGVRVSYPTPTSPGYTAVIWRP